MDAFRLVGTDVVKHAEPGSHRHRIYSRSERYELVAEPDAWVKPHERDHVRDKLSELSMAELRHLAQQWEVDAPSKIRKDDLIEKLLNAPLRTES